MKEKSKLSKCCEAEKIKCKYFPNEKCPLKDCNGYFCSECGLPFIPQEPKEGANFLQVGRTVACSNCHPERGFADCKTVFKGMNPPKKCECICHGVSSQIKGNKQLSVNSNKISSKLAVEHCDQIDCPECQRALLDKVMKEKLKKIEKLRDKTWVGKSVDDLLDEVLKIMRGE